MAGADSVNSVCVCVANANTANCCCWPMILALPFCYLLFGVCVSLSGEHCVALPLIVIVSESNNTAGALCSTANAAAAAAAGRLF